MAGLVVYPQLTSQLDDLSHTIIARYVANKAMNEPDRRYRGKLLLLTYCARPS